MKQGAAAYSRIVHFICLALLLVLAMPATPGFVGWAHAQEAQPRQGGGILRFLFAPRERQRQDRIVPPQEMQQPPARRSSTPAARRSTPTAPVAREPVRPAIEKAADARRVLVVGDFLAGGLSDGLNAAYAENPDVLVLDRSNGSSGLVRDDHYDWPARIGQVLEAEKPDVVVVMLGSNDRQQMRVGDAREQHRSDPWNKEYERRATALAKAVRGRQLPLLWVGNLPFKSSAMSSDMIAFNDIYRRVATDNGGEFIDVWDGFVDETGAFVTNGPDMNGQPAQLRSSDGINVTRQGRRKIAFYVEKPLARLLGTAGGTPDGVQLPGQIQGPLPEAAPVPEIDRTPPMAIDDYQLDGGPELLGASFAPKKDEPKTPSERLAREGVVPEPTPGRADDFSMPQPAQARTADPQRTTAVTR